ncbi:Druantia anti-phage system protein DruA [Ruegeria arenilitoris]|uniref:Druantia anti-phage system protein DruA n=1 Tax=Ruegeria arenilitoris TaxID=1173585 RepID=UPI0014816668|nr:Druantia anti-phage system protein DruA [Ruegeria arenilitoris]
MKNNNHKKAFAPNRLPTKLLDALVTTVNSQAKEDSYDVAAYYRGQARKHSSSQTDGDANSDQIRLAVCYSMLADFTEQGWGISVQDNQIFVEQPSIDWTEDETEAQVKKRIRKGFEAISNRQLADPTNREFIRRMEAPREFEGKMVSVLDVVDDGAELANELRQFAIERSEKELEEVSAIICPELVECRGDDKCPYTGYRLQDIWRYFRHTWSLEYKLLPGRTMRLLVRNAARPNKPVIGIVLLASPTANLLSRDKWIGWTFEEVVSGLLARKWSADDVGRKLFDAIKTAIKQIRTDDLVPRSALNHPKPEHFFALDQTVHKALQNRARDLEAKSTDYLVDIRGLDKSKITNKQWKELSETALFKKKRAEQLIPLLKALGTMKGYGFDKHPGTALYEALVEKNGKQAVQTALGEIKKVHLASEVADLSVCGAVAPYNKIIGGKLVTALMTSEEIREIYKQRYGKQVSEISSQIKGQRVQRSSDLKLLTTTALYGVGSNQYSSLTLRASKHSELASDVVWKKIDSSTGFTVTHISDETVQLMRSLGISEYGRRRINSVFGEGSSPRTRQIREGLNLLGINNSELLEQPNKKKVYGCEMFPGAKDQLLGFKGDELDAYEKTNSVSAISKSWARRWLLPRLKSESVLNELADFKPSHVSDELKSRSDKYGEIRPE